MIATTPKPFAKSCQCPIYNCTVMVRKHGNLKHSLMRALALANHVKAAHSSEVKGQ